MRKRKLSPKKKLAVLLAGTSLAAVLSGCSANLTESTFDLIKSAEEIKEELGQIHRTETGGQVVGSVSDPQYEETALSVADFDVQWNKEDSEFAATWAVNGGSEDLDIQIYADSDQAGYDGEKIGSFSGQSAIGNQTFTYALDPGEYYVYLVVEDSQGRNATSSYRETSLLVDASEQDDKYLKNVSITYEDGSVNFSWDDSGHERYRAVLINPETGDVLDETTVIGLQAKIQMPENIDAVLAGVSYLENGEIGPYQEVEISKD